MSPPSNQITKEDTSPDLFAIRRFRKRPVTAEEIETTRPFYRPGNEENGRIGVLLIHGFTATPATFREYSESLSEDGYTVSAPLLPGHGVTPDGLLQVTYDEWLEAVLNAYDQIQTACDKIFVIGISLGGTLSLHLSTRRNGISKLILISPAVYPLQPLHFFGSVLFPLIKKLKSPFWFWVAGDIKKKEGFELAFGKTAIGGLEQVLSGMASARTILHEVTTDVLIFQAETDHEIPSNKAHDILRKIGSKNKEIVWLKNSFHDIPRDNDASAVLERIRKEISVTPE
tara:strand:+ start:149 stop:1006 length:858 start_codon:yes stop_codon:yes gene_type:complete